jgi:hypothetical protein
MVGAVFIAMTAACGTEMVFACSDDSACSKGAEQGVCEMGFCAFDDSTCDSGLRYGDLAPPRQAGRCVPAEGEDEPPQESKGGDGISATSTTNGETTAPQTTIEPPEGDGDDSSTGAAEESSTGIPAMACDAVFVDEFEMEDIDPRWSTENESEQPVFQSRYGTSEGKLRLTVVADYLGSTWLEFPAVGVDEPAAVIAGAIPPASSWAFGYVELWSEMSHRIELHGTWLRVVEAEEELLAIPYDSIDHEWLRVSALEDETRYESSRDGILWDELLVVPVTSSHSFHAARVGVTTFGPTTSDSLLVVDHASVSDCSL